MRQKYFYSVWQFPQMWWEDPQEGATASGGDPTPAPPAQNTPSPQSYEALLRQNGSDASAVGVLLFNQNDALRRQLSELQAQLQQAQASNPAEDATILSASQAERWTAYQALGNPDEVRTQLSELGTLRQQVLAADVARVMQWNNNTVLRDRLGALPDGAEVRVNEGGTAVIVQDETETDLLTFAREQWADYLPALTVGQGTKYVNQTGGNKAPDNDVVGATLDKRYKRPRATTA